MSEYAARFPSEGESVAMAFRTTLADSACPAFPSDLGPPPSPFEDDDGSDAAETVLQPMSGSEPRTEEAPAATSVGTPARIGRYAVVRLLDEGAFGRVYVAWDAELRREVAIKVPLRQETWSPRQAEDFFDEGRMAARLRHPGIVTIHDVGHAAPWGVFIVMEYVEGRTLSQVLKAGDVPLPRLVGMLAEVAEAVHHAHRRGLVHRDLKPSNILIDAESRPRVADFGLALHEDDQGLHAGEVAGTATHMAPEQIRGEAHRLDARTDVWALGVILYQALSGRLPFAGRGRPEVYEEALSRDPRPPRESDDAVPAELERICLKCLSKRMADRYPSASALAEDLHAWLDPAASATASVAASCAPPVAPRGLRAFGGADAASFLSLLGGPRGRDGLPDSVRFWKSRIEATGKGGDEEPDPFPVGLLYGPSGGGKTSFVRAGLMPSLDPGVRVIRLEASPEGTEAALVAAIRPEVPGLSPDADPAAAVAALRGTVVRPGSRKYLIVLDQFEQWLQARPADPDAALARALRQCDGGRVQALILARDDFWMAVTRFFAAIEVPLAEGSNSMPVELPDARQARAVLESFGRACNRLTGPDGGPSAEEARFLRSASASLADHDGRVLPVRLALFAEVVRHRPWTLATLRELGGAEGIGATFLHGAFDSPSAPPSCQAHRGAAQGVLRALLPAATSKLRGAARSAADLREAAGYGDRPAEFAEVVRILDSELRLITLADADDPDASRDGPRYQLAHDFLVAPIRQWLEREQRATRSGRARLRLASIATIWADRPESRRLPTLAEWASIRLATRRRSWDPVERRMMAAAGRYFLTRAAIVAATCAALFIAYRRTRDHAEAQSRLEQMWTAHLDTLPDLLPGLDPYRSHVAGALLATEEDADAPARRRLVAESLLFRQSPTDRRAAALRGLLADAEPDAAAAIAEALAAHPEEAGIATLWDTAKDGRAEPSSRLRAAVVLARLDPDSPAWDEVAPAIARTLGGEDRGSIRRWAALLDPAQKAIVPALIATMNDSDATPDARVAAAEAVAETLGTLHPDPGAIAGLLPVVPDDAFLTLARSLARMPDEAKAEAAAFLDIILSSPRPVPADDAGKEMAMRREARTVIALARLGRTEPLWSRLVSRDDPRLRSTLIDRVARLGVAPRPLLDRLPRAGADEGQAILLALAEATASPAGLSDADRDSAATAALALFRNADDPGVHSAAELLLRRLGRASEIDEALRPIPPTLQPAGKHRWFVGPNGHTFTATGPLEGWVGTPDGDPGHQGNEVRHYIRTGRALDVATAEVTVGQYLAFLGENPGARVPHPAGKAGADPREAMGSILWYEAARYCNWLSAKAGLPPERWAYPREVGPGMEVETAAVDRPGFRMPTEAEWELFCRAGTASARPFGASPDLLPRYAWTFSNSDDRSHPVGVLWPNRIGLFDVLGNQWEWCHDGPREPGSRESAAYPDGSPEHPADDRPEAQVIVGDPGGGRLTPLTARAHRGGAYNYSPSWARSGARDTSGAASDFPHNGLRVVRTRGIE